MSERSLVLRLLKPRSLKQWLAWQETLHPSEIELGLERVTQVAQRLIANIFADGIDNNANNANNNANHHKYPFTVILVGGTNGKGSTIAFLSSILIASGYETGVYTSPHFIKYNERIQVNNQLISDADLCHAFEQIDQARGETSLTYFEFSTLAAIYYFNQKQCDVIIMEVGLGGRLDAVNLLQADCSLVTTVDLDHQDWLGDNIEAIAFEKAGIYKKGSHAIFGDSPMPQSANKHAIDNSSSLAQYEKDYTYTKNKDDWQIQSSLFKINPLTPLNTPNISGEIQYKNATNAIMVIKLLKEKLFKVNLNTINQGLSQAKIPGRYQYLSQQPIVLVDVAHNPQAAKKLNQFLTSVIKPNQKVHAIFAILKDKDSTKVINEMASIIDHWHIIPINNIRAIEAEPLALQIENQIKHCDVNCYNDFEQAIKQINLLDSSKQTIQQVSCITVVFGSFYTVAQAMEYFNGN